jgi:hypothetical protein
VNKFLQIIALLAIAALPATAEEKQEPVRVNCGGPNYTDAKGQLWKADRNYNRGGVSTMNVHVAGTTDEALFQNARYNEDAKAGLIYTFEVANGPYHVNLYFAETYRPMQFAGRRVFNVKMQNRAVFNHLDIFAEAGADAALIKGSDISVTNGKIAIEFDNVVQDAMVNAIEITPGNSGPQLSLVFRYPDGTPVAGTLDYIISSSMLSFNGHEALVNGQANCTLIGNPKEIGISMQFKINASLIDAKGHVLWNMDVIINPANVNLAAVQDSSLTVTVQKQGG